MWFQLLIIGITFVQPGYCLEGLCLHLCLQVFYLFCLLKYFFCYNVQTLLYFSLVFSKIYGCRLSLSHVNSQFFQCHLLQEQSSKRIWHLCQDNIDQYPGSFSASDICSNDPQVWGFFCQYHAIFFIIFASYYTLKSGILMPPVLSLLLRIALVLLVP